MDITLFITVFHIIGVALGVGGATVSDLLFFRAIADKKISRDELGLLETLSLVLWVGLALLFFSGVGFITAQVVQTGTSTYLVSHWFWAKMSIVLLLSCNALVFHNFVFPFLREHQGKRIDYRMIKPKAALFATTGVISIVSWYSALILGVTRGLSLPYGYLINLYLVLLFAGMLIAYLLITLMAFPSPKGGHARVPERSALARGIQVIVIAVALGTLLILLGWYLPRTAPPSDVGLEKRSLTHLVCISDSEQAFNPAQLTVLVGDTVAWTVCDDHHARKSNTMLERFALRATPQTHAHGGESHGATGHSIFDTHPIATHSAPEPFGTATHPHNIVGDTFYFTFTIPGTYVYTCPAHGGMEGVIIVTEA